MVYLLLASILMVIIRGQLNLAEYGCTEKSECAGLTATIKAGLVGTDYEFASSLIESDCSQLMGLCSVSCRAIDLCGELETYGMAGLTCGDPSKICEAPLTCAQDSDCVMGALPQCGTTEGVCIPQTSAECTDNGGCSVPGMGLCLEVTYAGKTFGMCSPEPCAQTSDCITQDYMCQISMGYCDDGCNADVDCNPLFDVGRTCNNSTGLCSTDMPSTSPTKSPTLPEGKTNAPTKVTRSNNINNEQGGGAYSVRCGLVVVFAFVIVIASSMNF